MPRSTSALRFFALSLVLSAGASSAGGCQLILGIGGELPFEEGGSGGTGGSGGSGGTGGSVSSSSGLPSIDGLGDVVTGAGLAGPCTPGELATCYTGPPGTKDVGVCKGGSAVCPEEGVWGACEGQALPQPESCGTPEDEDCNAADCAVWIRTITGEVFGTGVGVDGQGNIVASVVFKGPTRFAAGEPSIAPVGGSDVALVKYDRNGKLLWKKIFAAPDQQLIRNIAVTPAGDIVLAGDSYSDLNLGGAAGTIGAGAFVIRLDPDGNALWAKTAQSKHGLPGVAFVAVDSQGDVVCGGNGPDIDFGTGYLSAPDLLNFFVAKLDGATGQVEWVHLTDGEEKEVLGAIVIEAGDGIALTGAMGEESLGLPGADVAGCCNRATPFLVHLAPDGTYESGIPLAGIYEDLLSDPNGLAVDSAGIATIVGTFAGTIAFGTGQYTADDSTGAFVVHDPSLEDTLWSRGYFGENAYATASYIGVDSLDNVVLAGTYGGPIDLGEGLLPPSDDHYVVKLDTAGNIVWYRTLYFGGGVLEALAVGPLDDETAVVGLFFTKADLGTGKVYADQGVFVGKLGR